MLAGSAARSLLCCTLFLLSVVVGQAEGTYQRTKDGKTFVWNEHPKSGEIATWSGGRDSDGYASGFGTLTWYRTQETGAGEPKQDLYAYYFGNMARGKFNGPVNAHSKRTTSHALFTEGKRISPWAAGPAPSWTMPRSRVETVASQTSSQAEDLQPKPENLPSKSEGTESKPQSLQLAESHPPPKTYGAVTPTPGRPMPNYEAIHEQPKSEPNPDVPAEGPRSAETHPAESAAAKANSKLEIDPSLRALTGPPAALGESEPAVPEQTSASVTSKLNHLGKNDVINLSDAEARKRGYDLSRYDRPDPQLDPVDNTWSLSYVGKQDGAGAPAPKYFTVAVDDKTKKTAIVPGR